MNNLDDIRELSLNITDAMVRDGYVNTDSEFDVQDIITRELCDKFRSRNGQYDVIVPGSGGKDSAYVAHILKDEFNMHPLCITWAPHEYTKIGKKNFDDFTKSGFDNLLVGFHPIHFNFLIFNPIQLIILRSINLFPIII